MTADAALVKAAHAATGLAALIASKLLPWSCRSQHEAWLQGYAEGAAEVAARMGQQQ